MRLGVLPGATLPARLLLSGVRIGSAIHHEAQPQAAHVENIAGLERRRADQADPIDAGAVGAVEIVCQPAAAPREQAKMLGGDEVVLYWDVGGGVASQQRGVAQ